MDSDRGRYASEEGYHRWNAPRAIARSQETNHDASPKAALVEPSSKRPAAPIGLPMNSLASATSLRAVILAPHHADVDVRVRRTILVMAGVFDQVDVFWDAEMLGHRPKEHQEQTNIEEYYVHRQRGKHLISLFGGTTFKAAVVRAVRSASLVYIHASGIEGLVYAREARLHCRSCRIVFDYHDSVAYELYYQLKKLGLIASFAPAWAVYRKVLRRLAGSLDGVVGISRNQVTELEAIAKRKFSSAVIPNLRTFSSDYERAMISAGTEKLSFLWVGQIMLGRDLERIARWISRLKDDTMLHVFGEVINQQAESLIRATLRERTVFHGAYRGDADLLGRLPTSPVGVFLGWDDPCGTGINRIASPNKYFSYVNLAIPVIVDRRLEELAAEVRAWNAGIAVGDQAEFAEAAARLRGDYREFAEGMKRLKANYAAFDTEQVLCNFLKSAIK